MVADPAAAAAADAAAALSNERCAAVPQTAVLLVQCPDQPGVVAAIAQLLYGLGCNIVQSDQFTNVQPAGASTYFQRIEFDYSRIHIGAGNTEVLEQTVGNLAQRFSMSWRISYRERRKRVAIFVSKLDHCLFDILIRHQSGELDCDIPVVISNHPDLEHIARTFDIEFRHLPMKKEEGGKAAQEAAVEAVLAEHSIDVIVLARYMQILSADFCKRHAQHCLNIHHSSLPSFEGARPYHRAHERGVKIIGATAHFVTSDLDAGPIVEQDVVHVSHRDSVADLVRKGKDMERVVLARALRWFLQDRVLVDAASNKTVVFE